MTYYETLAFGFLHCVFWCTFWSTARRAFPKPFHVFDRWRDRWAERLLAVAPIVLFVSVWLDWPSSLRGAAAGVFAFSIINAIQTYNRVMKSG